MKFFVSFNFKIYYLDIYKTFKFESILDYELITYMLNLPSLKNKLQINK